MLWMRYWDSRAAFLKLGWKINTALYNSVGFSWFLSSKPEAYLQLHYFQIKVEFMSESTPKDEWVHGVLLASAPPLPIPQNPLSKVQWSSKLLFLSPCPLFFFFLPCVSFCRLFSRPRWDTSAKWVSLRRKRWPPADTSRWPPLPAPGQLHLSFSCKNRKNDTKTNSTFGTSGRIWIPSQHRQLHSHWYSSFQQLPSVYDAYKPFHEEHEFSCGICGTDNPFWSQASSEAPQLLCLRIKRQNATSVKLKTTSLHKC